MDTKKELQRVIQELKKPLNKKDRIQLECKQIQLEFNLSIKPKPYEYKERT